MTIRSLLSIVVTLFIMIYPTNHAFKEKCSRQSFFYLPSIFFYYFFRQKFLYMCIVLQ